MDIYSLSRKYWDFAFENPDKIKPNHTAIYFFAIEHCNRLGWKRKFGFPTSMAMEAVGIKSYNTFIKNFNELIEFGFFDLVEKSKNQYSSNVIALSNINEANDKSLDKALIKHGSKQSESTDQSTDSIDIQVYNSTNIPINHTTKEPDPKTEERIQKATSQITSFFGLSEIRQPKHYMTIGNFVRYHAMSGQLDHLAEQFTAYKQVKEKDPRYKHNWYNYIGNPEDSYQDGQWNIKDWVEELNRDKPKQDTKTLDSIKRTHELIAEENK